MTHQSDGKEAIAKPAVTSSRKELKKIVTKGLLDSVAGYGTPSSARDASFLKRRCSPPYVLRRQFDVWTDP